MTNPTPHGQVPEAMRLADMIERYNAGVMSQKIAEDYIEAAAELRRLHAYCQELEAQVIRDCMTHVQKPAEIEHVAGDLSKNSAKKNMNVYAELPQSVGDHKYGGGLYTDAQMLAFADATHALRTQQPAPATQQAPQQPCPTCAALARTVMLDQVSFDRKPDCYGIRQITEDEGVEEWEDIRTSPDVAREEANDMMATGRGELYEVVPLWTTPQCAPTAQAAESVPAADERDDFEKVFPLPSGCVRVGTGYASTGYSNWAAHTHCERWQGWQARAARDPAGSVTAECGNCFEGKSDFDHVCKKCRGSGKAADSVLEDAARYQLLRRGQHWSVIDGIGNDLRAEALDAAVDSARKQGANHDNS